MIRDLDQLANETFDAVVIGGGVYGLAAAWELASRGLRVGLLERGDFGGATSFNSLKTIHGGIRALQHGAVAEMREFVRERRALATMAPHLVRPLPFVVPTYRHPVRNRFAMGLFFAAYDRLSSDRNAGVDPSRHLPPSRTVGRADCLRLNPAIDPRGVTGGAVWHDYQLQSTERFAVALLESTHAAGGAAANYVEAQSLLVRGGRVEGIRAHDRLAGAVFDVRARCVVNAAGPWAWPLLAKAGCAPPHRPPPAFSLAMNLVVDHPALSHAVGGVVKGRFLFMVPWRDRSIVGTSHDEIPPGADVPDALAATPALVEAFLREAASAFPNAGLTPDHITLVHRGLLPAGRGHGTLLKRSIVHDHAPDGLAGLVTVVGVRYTTARATAELAGDRVCAILGHPVASRTARLRIAGAEFESVARYERDQASASPLPAPLVRRLIAAYGARYLQVAQLMALDASLAAPLSDTCAVTRGEVVHAVRSEMASHLTDALLRRTEAGAGGHPGANAVAAAADVMSSERGWSAQVRADEIAAFDATYEAAPGPHPHITPPGTLRPSARTPSG